MTLRGQKSTQDYPGLPKNSQNYRGLREVPRVGFDQLRKFLERRERLVAVRGRSLRPRQLLLGTGLDERREAFRLIQERRPDIYEPLHPRRSRKHPAHAIGTEIVLQRSVQPTDHRLSLGYRKPLARHGDTQGISAGAHALTPLAVTGRGDERWRGDAHPHLATATSALEREFPCTHRYFSLASEAVTFERSGASSPRIVGMSSLTVG